MTPSDKCFSLVKEFEGCKLTAYLDAAGVWTIGWGSTGPDVYPGLVWSQDQADRRMEEDVARYGVSVTDLLAGAETNQNQFDALVDFAYNLGPKALATSTLLKLHRAGIYGAAKDQFAKWVHAGGRVLEGLVHRRIAEAALYSTPES